MPSKKALGKSTIVKVFVALAVVVVIVIASHIGNAKMIEDRSNGYVATSDQASSARPGSVGQDDASNYLQIEAVNAYIQKVDLVYGDAIDGATDDDSEKLANALVEMTSLHDGINAVDRVPESVESSHKSLKLSSAGYLSAVQCLVSSNAYASKGDYSTATKKLEESRVFFDAGVDDLEEALASLSLQQ